MFLKLPELLGDDGSIVQKQDAIGTAIVLAIGVALDFFFAIPLLNLETWAKEHHYDTLYKLLTPPEWLVTAWDFVVGPFG
jgi:hypothetical protein